MFSIRNCRPDMSVAFPIDRKSTRLNSSHSQISYAVFCLKKKTKFITIQHWFHQYRSMSVSSLNTMFLSYPRRLHPCDEAEIRACYRLDVATRGRHTRVTP